MSHIVEVKTKFNDLDALELAAQMVGLELVRGQTTYRWYGRSVGDYALPAGVRAEDLGRCHHAIRVPNKPAAYEIGVIDNRDGTYTLRWDFWQGGYGLQALAGEGCGNLERAYATARLRTEAKRLGWMSKLKKDGTLVIAHPSGGTVLCRPDGLIEAQGFTGSACSLATAPLIAALGVKTGETRKVEYAKQTAVAGQL